MARKGAETQCEQILRYMDEHGSITSLEAIKYFGCLRLASRINDLRKRGYMIVKNMVRMENEDGSYRGQYAEYHLATEDDLL
ncbi:MAG: helix-turn-helix domain-containing protein [Paludibacteraceae bacterium]|nr:helix-turn-helix domain-containing protein [Paludibacteraceae bacterium]